MKAMLFRLIVVNFIGARAVVEQVGAVEFTLDLTVNRRIANTLQQ